MLLHTPYTATLLSCVMMCFCILRWLYEPRPSRCVAHPRQSINVWQCLSNCSGRRDKFFITESGVGWENSQTPPNGSPHLPQQWPHSINLESSLRYTTQLARHTFSVLTRQVEALMTRFDGGPARPNEKVLLLICFKQQNSGQQHPIEQACRWIEVKWKQKHDSSRPRLLFMVEKVHKVHKSAPDANWRICFPIVVSIKFFFFSFFFFSLSSH